MFPFCVFHSIKFSLNLTCCFVFLSCWNCSFRKSLVIYNLCYMYIAFLWLTIHMNLVLKKSSVLKQLCWNEARGKIYDWLIKVSFPHLHVTRWLRWPLYSQRYLSLRRVTFMLKLTRHMCEITAGTMWMQKTSMQGKLFVKD